MGNSLHQKNDVSISLVILLFLAMWLLYGWSYWNGDREAYELYYHSAAATKLGVEFGYRALNIISSGIGISFQHFQIAISLVTLALLLRYILKATVSPLLCSILYLVCFFPLDYVLIRNFLAFTIVAQAFFILFESKQSYRAKFIFLVCIATTVHQSSIVFLLFTFMPTGRFISLSRFVIAYCLFVTSYILLRLSIPFSGRAVEHLALYQTTIKSAFANSMVHIVSTIVMLAFILVESRNKREVLAGTYMVRDFYFVFNLNVLSLFFLILYVESDIFSRLMRTILFFNLMFSANYVFFRWKNRFLLFAYILIFGVYLVYAFIIPTKSLSLVPLFSNNLFF